MLYNIDFVFPYVNPADPTWRKQYKYFKGSEYADCDTRFRDFSLLKYIFRSIDTYAPWITRVVMIVAYKSQVPSFLKESNRLKIVEHKDFIPDTYRPTFNSNTIEMFIPKIQGLSEHFIYSNDDLLFINKVSSLNYFPLDNMLNLSYTFRKNTAPTGFQGSVKRTWDTIENFFGRKPILGKDYKYLKQYHGSASPRLLSDCIACYKDLEPRILDSLTLFRNVDVNINQYLFGYYSLLKGHAQIIPFEQQGVYVAGEDGKEKILDTIWNSPAKMLCINDTTTMTSDLIGLIYDELEKKFPIKSIYEV